MSEDELIVIAQHHHDDTLANLAMKELRDKFDETYIWCLDCDGLVCKEKDCCLNSEKIKWEFYDWVEKATGEAHLIGYGSDGTKYEGTGIMGGGEIVKIIEVFNDQGDI